MRVFVTGASGQLGYDVCKELTRRGIENRGVSVEDLDITDRKAVEAALENNRPDAVIHCAAYTAVDKAEDEAEQCWAVNVDGTRNLAVSCKAIGAKMLYISTDYVFPGLGKQFYEVTDAVNPTNVYGASKLAGELVVQSLLTDYFIVRISWVFGANGNNFIKTMLRLSKSNTELNVVCDQIGSPTYTADLAPLLCDMIRTDQFGLYHATNEGVCSWAEFAEEIFRCAGKEVKVNHILTEEYPTCAKRPLNSRLSKRMLSAQGFRPLPEWTNALRRYLIEIGEST
ncbi:dTDP-4-dehydrorhamnose reductase [Anaerotruncus colihominis]|uniref:dTDP-4-dehydrorhamnose reductase n=1 Tax=Anaerotruncus colihominis DSM 17241 TaxID=445972 RepID=B0PBK6_9FIRM|nr:dTDP-4-dehydrorhamnose reductase [Anaerotruncus colihominis]EDS10981.1 dTDP-4-dehydrorhamnose reductase [Anaerotruncus colihominis DSM 17241]UWN74985.1 dTDP-4-dehydrorhamnose reductase [Anaerotruncus colihominis]